MYKRLVQTIIAQKAESQTVEIKSAENGCPTRLYDSLSSFSNQDDGGVIVFGIDEKQEHKIVGVYDAQVCKKVTEQCNQMAPKVRALFTLCQIEGRTVVSAEIPSVDISERPVFYRNQRIAASILNRAKRFGFSGFILCSERNF